MSHEPKYVSKIAPIPLPPWHPKSTVALRTARLDKIGKFDLWYYCDENYDVLSKDPISLSLSAVPMGVLSTWERVQSQCDLKKGIGLTGALLHGLDEIDKDNCVRDYGKLRSTVINSTLPMVEHEIVVKLLGDADDPTLGFEIPPTAGGAKKLVWRGCEHARDALSFRARYLATKVSTLGILAIMLSIKDQDGADKQFNSLVDKTYERFIETVKVRDELMHKIYEGFIARYDEE